MLDLNKIYCMDCIEGMKLLDDNSIDSIVTDPPYELGFMGKIWDASGIAYNVEMWKEVLRVLKPGGYLLSFGGTRTYHRMACAIEDAGFEIRDQIQWIYGSGFPKSLNIGKAVDKLQNIKREIIGYKEPFGREGRNTKPTGQYNSGIGNNFTNEKDLRPIYKNVSEWYGWGTALKPANEPICVARKPISEKTVAENVLKFGTGGINIDACRIGSELLQINGKNNDNLFHGHFSGNIDNNTRLGRFPSNVIHDGSEEVLNLFPDSKGDSKNRKKRKSINGTSQFNIGVNGQESDGYFDSGSAARFFYCAKASKTERNLGLDQFEKKSTPNYMSGDEYRLDGKKVAQNYNIHPTVKPLKLIKYLVRLVTPKKGIVLDPFMGSGTTGMAAKSEGFKYIGFDMTQEYVDIANARIKAIQYQKKLF